MQRATSETGGNQGDSAGGDAAASKRQRTCGAQYEQQPDEEDRQLEEDLKRSKTAYLFFKAEFLVIKMLNDELQLAGLRQVDHVSQAVHRLGDKYLCSAEKDELYTALVRVFEGLSCSAADAREAIQQWLALAFLARAHMAGSTRRLSYEPLTKAKLAELKAEVNTGGWPLQHAVKVLIAAAETSNGLSW